MMRLTVYELPPSLQLHRTCSLSVYSLLVRVRISGPSPYI